MNHDKLQTIVESNRQQLTDIILSVGCTPFDAAEFAIQEYFLEQPNGEYDYHAYHDHFKERYLKTEYFDGSKHYRFGKLMTQVLDHLFDVQISKCYIAIKKAVYNKMDELKENDELWQFGLHIADFEEWCGAWSQEFVEGENEVVDMDWRIVKKTEVLTQ